MTDAGRHGLSRSTLGRYRLLCELGSGGMARVYLALTTGLAGFTKLAVLKVMRHELAQNPEAVKLFLAEARLAARFNHPNVVQTTEVGEDAGCYFINMEYLEGLPLGTLLGKSLPLRLPLAARLEIACKMLDGLEYLHELSDLDGSPLHLVHRDISPSNVFVTYEGIVKLLDFGVAKAEGVTEVTAVGSFKGKLGYAAPEQLRGQSDARSDVFTAGLLLWEMLSYQRLARARTQTQIVRDRMTGVDPELMRARGQGVAAQLIDICVKAAAPKPEDRYQSASALRDALRSYMLEHCLSSSSEQLRLLLGERFDVLRQATRRRIDQRLKEVQLEDAGLSAIASASARPDGPTPHPIVASSQRAALISLQPVRRLRPFLVPAGGVALMLAAVLSGALVAHRERRGSVVAVDRPSEATLTRPKADVGLGSSSEKATAAGSIVAQPQAPFEHVAAELQTDRLERDHSTPLGAGPSKPAHRANARTSVRPRPASRGLNAAVAQGAASPSGRGLPEEPPPSTNELSDFSHAHGTAKVARSIDTSSPYSN